MKAGKMNRLEPMTTPNREWVFGQDPHVNHSFGGRQSEKRTATHSNAQPAAAIKIVRSLNPMMFLGLRAAHSREQTIAW